MDVRHLQPGDELLAVESLAAMKTRAGDLKGPPMREQLERLLADRRNILIIALDGERPVGFLTAYQMDRFDRPDRIVYFYEIGVAPEMQRRGIGTAMVRELLSICRHRGVGSIWVGTTDANVSAKRLFESTGARRESNDYIEYLYTLEGHLQ